MSERNFHATGQCTCGQVHYEITHKPMFVHCCHCTWCQRETGAAFALNALIESTFINVTSGEIEEIQTPTNSGIGQLVIRCPNCKVALWSYYGAAKSAVAFVRVGTLVDSTLCPPDIHIYTSSKLPWVVLNDQVPQMEEYYRRSLYWPEESIARYKKAIGKTD